MKRIICIIFIVGVCATTFAAKPKEKETPLSNEEFMTKVAEDLKKAAEIIPSLEKELEGLRQDTIQKKDRIDALTEEKSKVDSMLTSSISCRMLIEYPLYVAYDSSLVANSINLLNHFKVAEMEFNNAYCKLMLSYLEEYNEYNEDIYAYIAKIQKLYFGDRKKNLPKEVFEKDIQNTKYCKKCTKDGIEGIPYLSNILKELQELNQSDKLSKEILQEKLDELK